MRGQAIEDGTRTTIQVQPLDDSNPTWLCIWGIHFENPFRGGSRRNRTYPHVATISTNRGLFISGDTCNGEQRVFGHRRPKTPMNIHVSPRSILNGLI